VLQRFCCIGLGNPGARYKGTRHNIGFDWIDSVCRSFSIDPKNYREAFHSHAYLIEESNREIYLLKPQTYMNLSGKALASWKKKFPGDSRLLMVYDDKDLPLGKIRFRTSGSDGGHRGLRSLVESFGSRDLPRLRLGIGEAEPGEDTVEHVLQRFSPEEKTVVEKVLSAAPEHFRIWLDETNIEKLMNGLNSWSAEKKTKDGE